VIPFLAQCLCTLLFAAPQSTQDAAPEDEETTPAAQDEAQEVEEEEIRGLLLNAEGAFPGYTLFSPLLSKTAYLVDMEGNTVHAWATPHSPTGALYLLDNGNLLRCTRVEDNPVFDGGGIGGRIQELTWEGEVVWDFELATELQTQHHDIDPLANGNLLLITWEYRSAEQAIARGRDPEQVGEPGLWPDAVLELRPIRPDDAEVVWEWHSWDHTIQDQDPTKDGYGSVPDHPGRIDLNGDHRDQPPMTPAERERIEEQERQMRALGYTGEDEDEEADDEDSPDGDDEEEDDEPRGDWLHTNAVDHHPGLDLIALSTPQMNEIWVIDHSTTSAEAAGSSGGRWGRGGDLLYRWGNPRNYGMGTDADRRLFYQHNPEWILDGPPGELRLLIFNNGGGRPDGDYSSVIELSLPFDTERGFVRPPGEAFGPAEPVWSYSDKDQFFSSFISGADRLPNGNTLVCQGAAGRVIEVTAAGEIVWEYKNPYGERDPDSEGRGAPPKALFRATRLPADHPGLAGREL
jgi:hypothetical protein